jgi:hypothetical protein
VVVALIVTFAHLSGTPSTKQSHERIREEVAEILRGLGATRGDVLSALERLANDYREGFGGVPEAWAFRSLERILSDEDLLVDARAQKDALQAAFVARKEAEKKK